MEDADEANDVPSPRYGPESRENAGRQAVVHDVSRQLSCNAGEIFATAGDFLIAMTAVNRRNCAGEISVSLGGPCFFRKYGKAVPASHS